MINEKEMEYFLLSQLLFFPFESKGSKVREGAVLKMQSKRKMKKKNYSVCLGQCSLRRDRGLEMHFSEEQRPAGAEMFKKQEHRRCDFIHNYSSVLGFYRK